MCRYQLKELVKEQLEVMMIMQSDDEITTLVVRVKLEDLEERTRQMGISNIMPFLESDLFKENKFVFLDSERVIVREFCTNP